MFFLHFEVTTLTLPSLVLFFFFFNDTATTEIYTLSLHDALPIFVAATGVLGMIVFDLALGRTRVPTIARDLVQAGVFGGMAFVVLKSGGIHPLSILTTSAVLTAVIGLALQSIMANVLAGLVLQIDRTFALGDWIQWGVRVGRIAEINWRSSSIVTREGDTAIV